MHTHTNGEIKKILNIDWKKFFLNPQKNLLSPFQNSPPKIEIPACTTVTDISIVWKHKANVSRVMLLLQAQGVKILINLNTWKNQERNSSAYKIVETSVTLWKTTTSEIVRFLQFDPVKHKNYQIVGVIQGAKGDWYTTTRLM